MTAVCILSVTRQEYGSRVALLSTDPQLPSCHSYHKLIIKTNVAEFLRDTLYTHR